jgi:hypothetical protein
MANTITATIGLRWNSSPESISMTVTDTQQQAGTDAIALVQGIGTTPEAIDLGDVTTIGFIGFKNKDPNKDVNNTNTIRIGNDPGLATPVYTLKAGQGTIVPTRNTTWFAVADVPTDLFVMAIEL